MRQQATIPKGSLVLVTGVNGYIASHIAEQLLEHGYRVRGTVRDPYKADYMHAVFDEKYGADAFEVEIVRDMAAEGAFDEVMKGCAGVIHVASDLTLNPDPHQVIPMVVSGVKNILGAAARNPCVKRFVYTSSSAAATPPVANKAFHVDASTWNEAEVDVAWAPPPYTEERRLAVYAASKTLAEKECWRFVAEEKPAFVLNAVLPNCNIGRILSKAQPASTGGWYKKMWDGDDAETLKLLHQFPPQHYVNVTDTALLHLAALLEEDVVGERLLAFAGPFNFNDTADLLEKIDADTGGGGRRWERIKDAPKDLKTVDTERAQELLRRYGRPGFTGLEASLKEAVES
ncbi:MAG: hypothetical protein LQ348_003309 [Seirophora lacunosa]|nr:MAG: hypothetical protein LQ344_000200 [Seirophora lacunosa]KAI4192003.1 MAG: hypothetical protein LQ348_003309 [Seirophora lacunosa]